jgi:hypothetical protein
MNPPYRLMKPSHEDRDHPAKIHYESDNGKRLMCEQSDIYLVADGERMRIWFRTKRDVTCKSCVKLMEIRVRDVLGGLTAQQYEDLLAHIETFKAQYPPPKEAVPASVNGLG